MSECGLGLDLLCGNPDLTVSFFTPLAPTFVPPSFIPTTQPGSYGPVDPNAPGPIVDPAAPNFDFPHPKTLYTPEPPPPSLPPADLLAAGSLPLGELLALGGVGAIGIGASLLIPGVPAPDEYGTQDLQALIDTGFYGNLVPRYQPPETPAQTELVPAVAPTQQPDLTPVIVTAPAIQPDLTPVIVTAPRTPPRVEPSYPEPGLFGIPAPDLAGLPIPVPTTAPAPQTGPARAPSPVVSPSPRTRPLPQPGLAPSAAPATQPQPGTAVAPLPAAPTPSPGSVASPVYGQVSLPAQTPAPSTLTQPLPIFPTGTPVSTLTAPESMAAVPLTGMIDGKSGQCPQPVKKKQQRKQRTVCHVGTYTELKSGLIKHPQRTVSCR